MGKITWIAGGSITETAQGDYTVYARNITHNAGQQVNATAKKTNYGTPDKPPDTTKATPEVKQIYNTNKEPLEGGATNKGDNGTQYGMVYGKEYEFEVIEFVNGIEPADDNTIRWEYTYTDDSGDAVVGTIKQRGRKATLKIGDLGMLGTTVTVRAYISKKLDSQNLDTWAHYRFRWFDWKTVEDEMNKRMQYPWLVNQGATSLCGMAAIFYLLLKKDGEGYAKLVKELHHKGKTTYNGYELKPNKDAAEFMYEMSPNNADYPDMPRIDWLTLAVLRSKESSFFGELLYRGEKENNEMLKELRAVNWPQLMVYLCKNFLGYENVNPVDLSLVSIASKKGFAAKLYNKLHDTALKQLEDIETAHYQGRQVLMMIDSDMLSGSVSYSEIDLFTKSHWIVYEGNLVFMDEGNNPTDNFDNAEKVNFNYFTWGYNPVTRLNEKGETARDQYDFLKPYHSLRVASFKSMFYGYIECWNTTDGLMDDIPVHKSSNKNNIIV